MGRWQSLLVAGAAALSALLPAAQVGAGKDWRQRVDEASGLAWGRLVDGDIPEDGFWEFIRPQQAYLEATFGPGVRTTYDLHRKEMDRLEAETPYALDPRVTAMKNLTRWPDPVVMHGSDLPGWAGKPLDGLRLYACRLGRFVPVPYQFDEITPDGEKVLPDGGPEANPEDGNRALDPQDELLFMAHDLGDRVRPQDWVSGLGAAQEIEVRDPLTGGKGWCYLLWFPGDAPDPSPLDYAAFNDRLNQHYGFYLFEQGQFKRGGNNLYRQVFNQKWKLPDHAGGTFENFIDRLKFRTRVRLFFGSVKLTTTEDDVTGDTLAVRDGPVRCNRRCWGRVRLPLGFKTPRIVSDIIGYDTLFVCPVVLSIPINPGLVLTDLTLYSGTDLNQGAMGSVWYNSNNTGGFLVDGKTSPNESAMDPALDAWRLVTGRWGTMMNRALWDPHFQEQAVIRIQFTDDLALGDPPEYQDGQIGMAYNFSTVRNLEPGSYVTELDWFFIPHFGDPDRPGRLLPRKVQANLDIVDRPLEISTGGGWFKNQPRPRGVRSAVEDAEEGGGAGGGQAQVPGPAS